jgi:prephenate dehydrogenase
MVELLQRRFHINKRRASNFRIQPRSCKTFHRRVDFPERTDRADSVGALLFIASREHGGFNRVVLFRKIAILGVGLLGGSLALAIRERKLAAVLQGYVRRDGSLDECDQAGLKDFATRDLIAVVRDADLVILCTPLAQMRELAEQLLPTLKSGAIVSDVGSVKASVVRDIGPIVSRSGAHFIGAHPMAGAEKMGVSAARADLFHNAVCILTPGSDTKTELAQKLAGFWRAIGARTVELSPEFHDELVARCSHLPHVVAAELANYVLSPSHPKEQPLLCANGFRDTTRIASGSPEMWRDIALANGQQLSRVLEVFIHDLQQLRRAIDAGDSAALETFFNTAKQRRDAWCGQNASPSPE